MAPLKRAIMDCSLEKIVGHHTETKAGSNSNNNNND